MSERGSRRRSSIPGYGATRTGADDPIASLQKTMDREEARRAVLARRAMVAAAVAVVLVAGAFLLRGEPAVADRAAAPSFVPAQSTTVTASAAVVEDSSSISATSSETLPPASVRQAPKTTAKAPTAPKAAPSAPKAQLIKIGIGVTGYEPSVVNASAASPVTLSVERGEGCAAGFLIPGLDVAEDNSAGPVTIDLGRVPAGSYEFTCGMAMIGGTLIVK